MVLRIWLSTDVLELEETTKAKAVKWSLFPDVLQLLPSNRLGTLMESHRMQKLTDHPVESFHFFYIKKLRPREGQSFSGSHLTDQRLEIKTDSQSSALPIAYTAEQNDFKTIIIATKTITLLKVLTLCHVIQRCVSQTAFFSRKEREQSLIVGISFSQQS